MQTVALYPEVNASGMARLLGVTKGAISQTLSRLEKKGILSKESDPYNKNELKISLTSFGDAALNAFDEHNADQWEDFNMYLESLSMDEHKKIMDFLARLETYLNSLA